MKLNLELELDWIDEEMTLDDAVKNQLIEGIISKIEKSLEDQVKQKVEQSVDDLITTKVNSMTEEIFNSFINRQITITDRYGDVIESYDKLEDLIKKRFDNFMLDPVDENGEISRGSYGKKYQRIMFIIDKQLKEFADKFTGDAVKKVSEEIQKHVQDGLKQKLGTELMRVLKVDKMLELGDGKKKRQ